MGRNGGGWAHYVGQEKCRPITGWISLANALDWSRPPRTMIGTSFWYMHTDQWRNDGYSADSLASPLAEGTWPGKHTADTIAQSARLGWMPFYPQFDANPLDVADEAQAAVDEGAAADAGVVRRRARCTTARCSRRSRTSTRPENWPRTLVLWRSNLMGSSAKGNEYFLKHLLGTHSNVLGTENPEAPRPREVAWHDEAPGGQARPAGLGRLPDDVDDAAVRRRAARRRPGTRSTTCPRPTCTRSCTPSPRRSTRRGRRKSDFETFHLIAQTALRAGRDPPRHPQGPGQRAAAARHPGRDGAARRRRARLERAAASPASPARTCRCSQVVERDYTAIADKLATRRPAGRLAGLHGQERHLPARGAGRARWPRANGVMLGGAGDGRPAIDTDAASWPRRS